MNIDVFCVGSALLDVFMKSSKFVKVPSGEFVGGVALCEEFGGKTEVEEAEVIGGGGGSNVAVSFARKGIKTALIAEMGTDLIAAALKEGLRREQVICDYLIEEEDEQTGISSIMVSPDGGRSVAVHRGASRMLTKEDIPWDQLKAKCLYISSLGGNIDLLEGLLGHAKAHGMMIACNPGKKEIQACGKYGGIELFNDIDVLIMNREEAELLSGLKLSEDSVWQGNTCFSGAKTCVITDGKEGGKICRNGQCFFYNALETTVVEETGAGDAFGSGFVSALILDKSIEEAIEWGRKQAASVVKHMGAKKGLLSLEQISS